MLLNGAIIMILSSICNHRTITCSIHWWGQQHRLRNVYEPQSLILYYVKNRNWLITCRYATQCVTGLLLPQMYQQTVILFRTKRHSTYLKYAWGVLPTFFKKTMASSNAKPILQIAVSLNSLASRCQARGPLHIIIRVTHGDGRLPRLRIGKLNSLGVDAVYRHAQDNADMWNSRRFTATVSAVQQTSYNSRKISKSATDRTSGV